MANKRQNSESVSRDDQPKSKVYFDYLTGLLQSISNLRWDEVNFYLGNMNKHLKSVATDSPDILSFHEIITGYALGFQQLAQSKTIEDKEKALILLDKARKDLIKLRIESSQFSEDPGAMEMTFGIEQQILAEQIRIAEYRGDENEASRLKQQLLQVQKNAFSLLEPDNPYRQILQVSIILEEILPDFLKGTQALRKMNLDLAQQYLAESNRLAKRTLGCLNSADAKDLILKSVEDLVLGLALCINGYFVYIRILRSAIIGGVSKKDTRDLEKIERDFIDAEEMIKNATSLVPDLYRGKIDLSELEKQSEISKNFRSLCERNLSPKKIAQSAAPKVVFFFLGTFLVLMFGLPMSGLVAELESRDLGFILIVSLFVSVIGTFGFEANRLVPLFDVFTKMLPWGGGSKDENKK
jgi:hypothetical protein